MRASVTLESGARVALHGGMENAISSQRLPGSAVAFEALASNDGSRRDIDTTRESAAESLKTLSESEPRIDRAVAASAETPSLPTSSSSVPSHVNNRGQRP